VGGKEGDSTFFSNSSHVFVSARDTHTYCFIHTSTHTLSTSPSLPPSLPPPTSLPHNRDLYSPMKIFSQSQSEKGASPKLAALLKAEAEMEVALDRLQLVAKGDLKPPKKEGGGLFGFGGGEAPADKYTGMSQEKIASALYADTKTAFNAWVEVTNKGEFGREGREGWGGRVGVVWLLMSSLAHFLLLS